MSAKRCAVSLASAARTGRWEVSAVVTVCNDRSESGHTFRLDCLDLPFLGDMARDLVIQLAFK